MLALGNLNAHETMFEQCHEGHPLHRNEDTNNRPPVAIFTQPPIYPKRELNRGREGAVIVEYTITKDGEVKDIKVLSSTSTAFSVAAKQAVKKFKYEPRKIDGNPVEDEGWKHKVSFKLDGEDSGIFMDSETLDFNPAELTKIINKLSRNPQKALTKLKALLEEEKNEFHIAILNFLMTHQYFEIDPAASQEQLQSLERSMLALEKLDQNEINVINLKSMVTNRMSHSLLDEKKNKEAKMLLEPFLLSAWSNNFVRPSFIYNMTINYAIAAYNTADYCSAFYGFERAIKQGKALSINNPNLEGHKEAARKNMSP